MSIPEEQTQTPLRKALHYDASSEPGTYALTIPSSVCFGVVTLGGFVVSYVHKASVEFVSKAGKDHRHVRQTSVQFFRPVLPTTIAKLKVSIANASKLWTTLKFEVSQNDKICLTGFITLTDLLRPGHVSVKTGWRLSPPPTPLISLDALRADMDPRWVSYLLPFAPKNFRRPQAYMRYYIPIKQHPSRSLSDTWVSPAWVDDEAPNGAVWTDELVHFALDNVIPLLNDLVEQDAKESLHELTVKAGLKQRQARFEGKDDKIIGEGLTDKELLPSIVSTISMSTEIVKPLPEQGTKWLFVRAITKSLKNDRMDYDITVLDESGDLVASSQQVMQVIPYSQKKAKKAVL